MCMTCDHEPCLRTCPEAYGQPVEICQCDFCNEPIYAGDETRELVDDDSFMCKDCASREQPYRTWGEIIALLGYTNPAELLDDLRVDEKTAEIKYY